MLKEFRKSDLKNRMVVECENGIRCMVAGDVVIGNNWSIGLDEYNDCLEMKHRGCSWFDIVKVYGIIYSLDELAKENLSLIWQREGPKEVTMAEIEEKFGCRVKIVKE